jgi:hypothetical protein
MGIKFEFLDAKGEDSVLISTENTNILFDRIREFIGEKIV